MNLLHTIHCSQFIDLKPFFPCTCNFLLSHKPRVGFVKAGEIGSHNLHSIYRDKQGAHLFSLKVPGMTIAEITGLCSVQIQIYKHRGGTLTTSRETQCSPFFQRIPGLHPLNESWKQ